MEEHNEPDPHRLEPWDWEQPESVERRMDPKNGIEDYFSTTAEMRAQQSLHDKEQKKLTDSLNADVEDFTFTGNQHRRRYIRSQKPVSKHHLKASLAG